MTLIELTRYARTGSFHLDVHLDLDARTQWNLRNAKRRTRVFTDFTEYVGDKFRRAVRYQMLVNEIGCGIDEAYHLHDPGNAIQIANVRV